MKVFSSSYSQTVRICTPSERIVLLDDKNRVSNSAGQLSLMVAKVDSLGKADFDSSLQALQIQTETVGQAVATSEIDLAINFPADAQVATIVDENGVEIPSMFNPVDPTTYAKSSAMPLSMTMVTTTWRRFYYARTQVVSSDSPSNKWQNLMCLWVTNRSSLLSAADPN